MTKHNPETGLDCVSAGAVRRRQSADAVRPAEREDLAGDQTAEQVKHTPGPWFVDRGPVSRQLCVVSDDTWICGQLQSDNETRIDTGECIANARLIAAAPEMLAALKVHQEWNDKEWAGPQYPAGVSRDNGGENVWRAWWEEQLHLCDMAGKLTREAIAKAEGRS